MTLKELTEKMAAKSNTSKAQVRRLLDSLAECLKEMRVGDRVIIKGFGTFRKEMRKARTAKIGGVLRSVPAKEKLKFKSHI